MEEELISPSTTADMSVGSQFSNDNYHNESRHELHPSDRRLNSQELRELMTRNSSMRRQQSSDSLDGLGNKKHATSYYIKKLQFADDTSFDSNKLRRRTLTLNVPAHAGNAPTVTKRVSMRTPSESVRSPNFKSDKVVTPNFAKAGERSKFRTKRGGTFAGFFSNLMGMGKKDDAIPAELVLTR